MARRFTEEEKEIIAMYYPIKTPAEVAEMLGRSVGVIRGYAYKNKISNNRYWTKEEEEYLIEKYGTMTAAAIARRLKKPYNAVLTKIVRLGIGTFAENVDGLHLAEVCRLVGRDKETIKATWVKYGLRIKKKGAYSIIHEDDLIDFMKNNPERWDATQCETYFFERFDWFREKRIADRNKMCERRWGQSVSFSESR